jgi:hypothetical protein
METIQQLFYKERPYFDGKPLYIDRIEMLNINNLHYNKTLEQIGNEIIAFHGTPLKYVDNIINNGFDIDMAGNSMSGHIGKGLYFSSLICQSIYYQLKEEYLGTETYFQLIVCKLALGKFKMLKRSKDCINIDLIDGYNSHSTTYSQDRKNGYEYCIFDSNQILPYAILHMKC